MRKLTEFLAPASALLLMSCAVPGGPGLPAAQAADGTVPTAPAGAFIEREEVRDYIRQVSDEHGLDRHRLAGLFTDIHSQQSILQAIATPAERTLTWREYRPIFLTDKRIDQGRDFLLEHEALFTRAETTYGVPAEVMAAVIGVESFYGRLTGRLGVLESLATLAFDYPPRAEFFRSELTEFLVLASAEGRDPLSIKGSYAGAMGMPQFISSSYRRYAVDFDGDGERNLFDNPADVIGSVANYLAEHGWERDAPVADQWSVAVDKRAAVRALVSESLKPAVAPDRVVALGFKRRPVTDELWSVMRFDGKAGEEFFVGYPNFYAITRYNHSRLYALAVHQLALHWQVKHESV